MTDMFHYPEHHASIISHMSDMTQEEHHTRSTKSIEFDDLLPILISRGVRSALIKIDIETSESYMCQTGSKIFDEVDIKFIQME
jgi:hypothetical protein